jgi:hypothetical protein
MQRFDKAHWVSRLRRGAAERSKLKVEESPFKTLDIGWRSGMLDGSGSATAAGTTDGEIDDARCSRYIEQEFASGAIGPVTAGFAGNHRY